MLVYTETVSQIWVNPKTQSRKNFNLYWHKSIFTNVTMWPCDVKYFSVATKVSQDKVWMLLTNPSTDQLPKPYNNFSQNHFSMRRVSGNWLIDRKLFDQLRKANSIRSCMNWLTIDKWKSIYKKHQLVLKVNSLDMMFVKWNKRKGKIFHRVGKWQFFPLTTSVNHEIFFAIVIIIILSCTKRTCIHA